MHKTVLGALLVSASSFLFDPVLATPLSPYQNTGVPNIASYTFTAAATGDVTGFFAGASASDISRIGLSVNGATPMLFGLSNQTSTVSRSLDFGAVVAGDALSFILNNLTAGTQLSSDPDFNADGLQHVFADQFESSGGAIPSGVQISFEDLLKSQGGDFDHNDAPYVFTNVAFADPPIAAPLPAALPMFMGAAAVILLMAKHRKKRKSI